MLLFRLRDKLVEGCEFVIITVSEIPHYLSYVMYLKFVDKTEFTNFFNEYKSNTRGPMLNYRVLYILIYFSLS